MVDFWESYVGIYNRNTKAEIGLLQVGVNI